MKSLALLLAALLLVPATSAWAQTPAGSAFTYQGQLVQSGLPVNGDADLIFTLFDAPTSGTQIGSPITLSAVAVDQGVFNVELDFGSNVFTGDTRYLQIQARSPAGTGDYVTLLPRQELTPVPYAIHALNVSEGGGWELNGSALTNTNTGFVGINGSSPLTGAEIFGVRGDQTSGYGGMYMALPTADGWPFYGYDAGPETMWTYLHGPTGSWRVHNNGDRLTVEDTGNVGIGTTTPQARLDVAGVVRTSGGVEFPDGTVQTTAGGGGGSVADSDWTVDGNNVYNDTAEDVMIGTNTPANAAKLTVAGGELGITRIQVDGSLGSVLGMSGGDASLELQTVFDESRLTTGSGNDLSFVSGRNIFQRAGTSGFQRFYTNGTQRMIMDADGFTAWFDDNNNRTIEFDGFDPNAGSGVISLTKTNGTKSVEIMGSSGGGDDGGQILLYTDSNSSQPTVVLDGEYGGTAGGALALYNSSGQKGIELVSDLTPNEQAEIWMYKPDGTRTIEIEAEESGNPDQGSTIKLFDDTGNLKIELDADYGTGGEGRITTEVLEITGGSDLSEQFDVLHDDPSAIAPGSVVSIDPSSPGDLRLATEAFDRRVAGIISGAGGVRPGMLMGQRGTEADGQHPVALTGRVYCKVDARYGAIEPGDLLTTSGTPGHAMKVDDPVQAAGAILGKAMTGLESGTGMVLVLVSLQ